MNEHYPFENPPLPYDYYAMEPYIDTKTMQLHHDRHLKTYVDNLNQILGAYPEYQNLSLDQLLISVNSLPDEIQIPIKHNGGGVYNHIFFFQNMCNPSSADLAEPLESFIMATFGSLETFQKVFAEAALAVFGSGYAWLVLDSFGRLKIITTRNQDTPLPLNMYPILNLDVWEHAYYLKHYNVRADYSKDWFHVINWERANRRFRSDQF